jgi:hypothetical protein
MSFDGVAEAAARRLARPHSRRKALGLFTGAAAALGLGLTGLENRAFADSGNLTLVNNTGQTIWPGVAGTAVPNGGGWELPPGASTTISVPANWSGRIWARTNCDFGGSGSCGTGDCGAGLACNGAVGAPNATLAEFTLGGGSSPDYYDVSLVDAFNVPITITPQGGAGCAVAGCTADLGPGCPSELQDTGPSGTIVACLSSCSKFGGDQYCCTGSSGSPSTCDPGTWQVNSAAYFKSGCPNAFSYAFDPVTATFTCQGASGYVITFSPFGGGAAAPPPPASAPSSASPSAPAPAPSALAPYAPPAPAPPAPPRRSRWG